MNDLVRAEDGTLLTTDDGQYLVFDFSNWTPQVVTDDPWVPVVTNT